MAISEAEAKDLEKFHAYVAEKKIKTFDLIMALSKMTNEELKRCGYNTLGDALIHNVKRTMDEITKLTDAHIRKYPDK